MSDYIKREAVLSLAKDICVLTKWDSVYHHRSIDPLDVIDLPAADVRPVVRARWIESKTGFHCSACKSKAKGTKDGALLSNFCPNCGADMREPPKEVDT